MKTATMIALVCSVCSLASVPVFAASHRGVDPIKTVRLKFEAFDRHDVAAIENIYAADATLRSPDYPDLKGNSRIADTYRRVFDAIADAKDNVESLDRSGDKVYAQFVLTGHLKSAADKPVSVRILSVYTVKGGHIIGDSTYYDRKMP
jgi:ketosteroid isomerase-like protein